MTNRPELKETNLGSSRIYRRHSSQFSSTDDTKENEFRRVFSHAKRFIVPSSADRFIYTMYAKRTTLIFFAFHFFATIMIWQHFAIIKYGEQEMKVPAGAPNFYWKRIAPPLEFGSMHAILFQMALLPLTMSRFTISALSTSSVNQFIPMNKMLGFHIHLGWVMVLIVLVATIFFFIFFGKLCADGEQTFCNTMRSEIMSTGYAILGSLFIIGGTSFFRYKIPYEIFYVIHHLVFAMYLLSIIHTFDVVQRTGERSRNQTFKWFVMSLLYYVADRAAMHMMHKYRTKLTTASCITSSDGKRMITLTMKRPFLLDFEPGQYVFLRIRGIDIHWHPFSIASEPSRDELEFYMEVFGSGSWTDKLWTLLGDSNNGVEFEIMGPYGSSLIQNETFTHGLAVGAGTGIVPIMSVLRQHISVLLNISPDAHLENIEQSNNIISHLMEEKAQLKGSFFSKFVQFIKNKFRTKEVHHQTKIYRAKQEKKEDLYDTILERASKNFMTFAETKENDAEMRKYKSNATAVIKGKLFQGFLALLSEILLGLTISWNMLPDTISFKFQDNPVDLRFWFMPLVLKYFMIVVHSFFVLFAIFIWNSNKFLGYADLMVALVTPFADWYFFVQYTQDHILSTVEITLHSFLTFYICLRFWKYANNSQGRSLYSFDNNNDLSYLQNLTIIWVTRSAHLVTQVGPDIEKLRNKLVEKWGVANVDSVCPVFVFVTDKDAKGVKLVRDALSHTNLYKSGALQFGRPNFDRILQDYNIRLASSREYSNAFLGFCGSPRLASELADLKLANDLLKTMLGVQIHNMEYFAEHYGGVKSAGTSVVIEEGTKGSVIKRVFSESSDSESDDN